jgi:hypothetical protein
LLFSSLCRKKTEADFNGGSLTSDTGALLLRELDRRLGLIEAVNRCIPDPRNPIYTVHQQRTMLAIRCWKDLHNNGHRNRPGSLSRPAKSSGSSVSLRMRQIRGIVGVEL